jgi:hypothetical protein
VYWVATATRHGTARADAEGRRAAAPIR